MSQTNTEYTAESLAKRALDLLPSVAATGVDLQSTFQSLTAFADEFGDRFSNASEVDKRHIAKNLLARSDQLGLSDMVMQQLRSTATANPHDSDSDTGSDGWRDGGTRTGISAWVDEAASRAESLFPEVEQKLRELRAAHGGEELVQDLQSLISDALGTYFATSQASQRSSNEYGRGSGSSPCPLHRSRKSTGTGSSNSSGSSMSSGSHSDSGTSRRSPTSTAQSFDSRFAEIFGNSGNRSTPVSGSGSSCRSSSGLGSMTGSLGPSGISVY